MNEASMNEASRWRLDMAQGLAPAYADHPGVRAVEVGGSVSRGCADRFSDIEIGVFWAGSPSEAARREAAERAGGREYRAYEFGNEEWSEEYTLRGVKIDVSHRLTASMEGWLADVVERHETAEVKQNLISAIRYAVPLHGSSLLAQWRAKADGYPAELAEAVVRENLMLGPHQWLEMLAERGSLIELYGFLRVVEKRLIGMLMGLNRMYHPGFKWLDRMAASLPLAPPDLGGRLRRVFRQEPQEGVREARALIDETYALIEAMMPQLDTAPARARLTQSRRTWEGPPPSDG